MRSAGCQGSERESVSRTLAGRLSMPQESTSRGRTGENPSLGSSRIVHHKPGRRPANPITQPWPEPTTEPPGLDTLERWLFGDGDCEATDGCIVEPDGACPHGHPSWLILHGLI